MQINYDSQAATVSSETNICADKFNHAPKQNPL